MSEYQEPGIYQQEQLQPINLSISPLASTLAIIGVGPRVRAAINALVRRGQVSGESVSFAASPPYLATLANKSNRRQQDTELLRNGQDVIPTSGYSFLVASMVSLVSAPGFAIPINAFVTLSMDGKTFLSIPLTAGGPSSLATIAGNINSAMNASPIYGALYANVAQVVANAIVLTSPQTNPALSDIRFIPTPADVAVGAVDEFTTVFGVAAPFIAPTMINLVPVYFDPTATYSISYIALDTSQDPLPATSVKSISKIGSIPGVTNFTNLVDYTLSSNDVDWSPNTEATLISPLAGPYTITAGINDRLRFSVNGLPVKSVTMAAGVRSAASIASELNAALILDPAYGPLYGAVFGDSGGKLTMTAPALFLDLPSAQGTQSILELFPTPQYAGATIFGVGVPSLPYMVTGSSNQPVPGASYFVSFTYDRPSTDYNSADDVNHTFLRESDALAYTGSLTKDNISTNRLGLAASMAFDNGAPRVVLIQVDDSTSPGLPTVNQFKAAIVAAADSSLITDIVALDTRLAVQTALLNHVEHQSSQSEKNYRLGWYGMARNTPIGSIDAPDTMVYRSQGTLQTTPDSPARGRSILCAPSNISRVVTYADATSSRVLLDGSYLAVCVAARKTSFESPAMALLRKVIVGVEVDDFQVYAKAERRTLSSQGVCVVAPIGGKLELTDPVSTEQGSGNVIEFIEPSAMAQKDAVVRVVDQTLDRNVVGIVPSDVSDYINDIKGYISQALQGCVDSGVCGRYVDGNGNSRSISLSGDIQVSQDPHDPRKYQFRYFFNLRYPGKSYSGVWSVDSPFLGGFGTQTA